VRKGKTAFKDAGHVQDKTSHMYNATTQSGREDENGAKLMNMHMHGAGGDDRRIRDGAHYHDDTMGINVVMRSLTSPSSSSSLSPSLPPARTLPTSSNIEVRSLHGSVGVGIGVDAGDAYVELLPRPCTHTPREPAEER